jgi:stage V sporulation protein SpoVS
MNRPRLMLPAAVALALLTVSAAAQPAPQGGSLAERLLAAERAPLQDPGAGRLYPAAAALLASARELPAGIELVHPPIPAAPQAAAQPAAPQPPAPKPWPQVVDAPVVDEQTLAHTRFEAGDYAGAAARYSRLHEQSPDDVYITQMLFLSEHNGGDTKDATALLDALKAKPETQDWANWISAMVALADDTKETK